jgi:hypothetical protein
MGPWANAVAFTGQKPYYSRHLPTCLISAWIGGNIRLITRYGTLSEWVHTYDIANAVACTGRLPTNVSLFTSPTNVSDIGLNRGKYLSHFQVGNAVRMIHIAAWVHGLMLSHSQARNPTIHVTYQRVWYRPELGVISVSFPGRQRCQNDPYRCMGPWANAVAFTGQKPNNTRHLPTCLKSTYQRVWYRPEWGVISVSFPGRQRCQNDPYRCMGPWANAVAFIGHLPTKMSDMLPTIHLTYQRVWYRSEWGVISVSLPGMQRCQNDPYLGLLVH